MTEKKLPFKKEKLQEIKKTYPTPFHIYDEKGIRDFAKRLKSAFSWVPGKGFKNYFAVKACANPHILKILSDEGFGADCSSMAELIMSEKVGIVGENIMFTSNNTPANEFQKAKELGAIINLDDVSHIDFLEDHVELPELICFRYNPGELREGNDIIGNPVEAKYGLTHDQIIDAYKTMKEKGAKRFGLHAMIVSNMRDVEYLIETARMLFELAVDISKAVGIDFDFINLGGGIGIPYHPDDSPVDIEAFGAGVHKAYKNIIEANGLKPIRIVMESGRAITGPYGFLVSEVRHVAEKYRGYVGLDSSMADLMRPALYGSYHHITVMGKESDKKDHVYDVTGSLCENNDKFAIQRELPKIERGDLVVIHDTGAHGYAMGFQYNGKLRSAELLLKEDGSVKQIRRAETLDDYFATLDFSEF